MPKTNAAWPSQNPVVSPVPARPAASSSRSPPALTLALEASLILFSVGGILFVPIIGLLYLLAIYLAFTDTREELRPYRWLALFPGIAAAVMTLISSAL